MICVTSDTFCEVILCQLPHKLANEMILLSKVAVPLPEERDSFVVGHTGEPAKPRCEILAFIIEFVVLTGTTELTAKHLRLVWKGRASKQS